MDIVKCYIVKGLMNFNMEAPAALVRTSVKRFRDSGFVIGIACSHPYPASVMTCPALCLVLISSWGSLLSLGVAVVWVAVVWVLAVCFK